MARTKPDYKYDEERYFREIQEYVDNTYDEHYQMMGISVIDFIVSNLESADFLKGCVLKYITRYGKKNGHDRKDLLKAIHYLFFLLYYHDKQQWPMSEQMSFPIPTVLSWEEMKAREGPEDTLRETYTSRYKLGVKS